MAGLFALSPCSPSRVGQEGSQAPPAGVEVIARQLGFDVPKHSSIEAENKWNVQPEDCVSILPQGVQIAGAIDTFSHPTRGCSDLIDSALDFVLGAFKASVPVINNEI